MTRCAMVYRRKGEIFVHSQSKLSVGAWIATLPFLSLGTGSEAETIGRAIREALSASVEGVPTPESYKELFRPIFELSGTRTWAEFSKSAVSADISQSGDTITIRPSVNRGAKYGFEPKKDGIVELQAPSDEEIAQALNEVLAASE